jgi:hypothetical protein
LSILESDIYFWKLWKKVYNNSSSKLLDVGNNLAMRPLKN